MAIIPISNGYQVLVDDEDVSVVSTLVWLAHPMGRCVYARSTCGTYMHRMIMEHHGHTYEGDSHTDHINREGLDNRKSNLRVVDRSLNLANGRKYRRKTSSKYTGVSKIPSGKWRSFIVHNKRRIHLGYFLDEKEAAKRADQKRIELYGLEECLRHENFNFPEDYS